MSPSTRFFLSFVLLSFFLIGCRKNKPVADFTPIIVRSGNHLKNFKFYNESTNATSYKWHFGDGDSSTAVNGSHIYGKKGEFRVTLFAYNDKGDVDSTSRVVQVGDYLLESLTLDATFELTNHSHISNCTEFEYFFYGKSFGQNTTNNRIEYDQVKLPFMIKGDSLLEGFVRFSHTNGQLCDDHWVNLPNGDRVNFDNNLDENGVTTEILYVDNRSPFKLTIETSFSME